MLNDLWASGEAPWRIWDAAEVEAPMKRALVTGGHGFVASHLARALLERGDAVTVLDLAPPPPLGPGPAGDRPGGRAGRGGPAATRSAVGATVEAGEFDVVFHLAAQTLVGPAMADPAATFEANVRGTWTLLEACRRADVPAVVVASSDKAYGPQRGAALPRGDAAATGLPLRGEQGGGRRDRAQLPPRLRPAGRGHPLRQRLRRRRPQLLAPDPGSDRRRARRPPAADPLRRQPRARLPLRRRRGRRLPGDRARGRRRRPGGGGGVQRRRRATPLGGRGAGDDRRGLRRRPRPRIPRHRQPGRRDRSPVRRLGEAARAAPAGTPRSSSATASPVPSSGTASTRRRAPDVRTIHGHGQGHEDDRRPLSGRAGEGAGARRRRRGAAAVARSGRRKPPKAWGASTSPRPRRSSPCAPRRTPRRRPRASARRG